MIVVPVKEGENIEKALKKFKRIKRKGSHMQNGMKRKTAE